MDTPGRVSAKSAPPVAGGGVLYLMHVDWNWIRQRPQALAAALADRFPVRVLYRVNPHRGQLPGNPRVGPCLPLLPIPERVLGKVSHFLQKVYISCFSALWRPRVVWVTFPDLWPNLPEGLLRGRILVYDCMDLAEGFFATAEAKARIRAAEDALLARADLVLCSSNALVEAIAQRASGRVLLVRNAAPSMDMISPPALSLKSGLDLCYFGTVAHWIDWDLLREVLDAAPDVRLHLVGPQESSPPWEHPRLIFHGPVRHEDLPGAVAQCHAFVMPFRVDGLIRRVDPVKLYEYLALGRPVFSVRYPEVERFGPHVRFFSGAGELLSLIDRLRAGDAALAPEQEAVRAFLAENTWNRRAEVVLTALDELPPRP